jgi:hypothetical protein
MKIRVFQITVFALAFLVSLPSGLTGQSITKKAVKQKDDKGGKVVLFNDKDLSNWTFKLKDPAVDPAGVFIARDGVIHIKGDPFGYMRTNGSYSDYRLHVEYRWPKEASNSGIFIHAQLPDTIWLKCFECQLQAGNAGDFICMNGSDMTERTDKSKRNVKKLAASSEKPAGEWNIVEVVCSANTIEVFVNGVLQNKASGVSDSSGHICLQSEGKDVEFRNVFLTRMKK